MAKIGDTVRFLNSIGGGRITKIEGQLAYVEEDDGFETPILLRECVVVDNSPQAAPKASRPASVQNVRSTPEPKTPKPEPEFEELPESPEGELLNIVLAFEPRDSRHLSVTTFDAVLVNDSNYYIYYTFATRSDSSSLWHVRSAGIIEPSMQNLLCEITRDDLPDMDRVSIQCIAFKQGRDYRIKAPVSYESRLDTTKFAKLHCFHANTYFDDPVIALDIVKDDRTCRMPVIDPVAMREAMQTKASADLRSRPVVKRSAPKSEPIVVDLHIDQLVDSTTGMDNAAILERQLDEFRSIMQHNIRNRESKIIFIHGKGEGVLRKALLDELKRRYPHCTSQDASFREYGYGATQVTIH